MELQPNIRELIYTYFYLVDKQIKGLTWKQICNYMNEDSNIKYIECVEPEIYYTNNVTLSKWHKQDYELITDKIKNIKSPIKYSNVGWNLNHYYEIKLLTLDEIAEIPHASKVVKLEYIKMNPDIFDIQIIYDRFNINFNPNWFNKKNNQDKYRIMCLNGKYTINYSEEQWYSDSFSILLSILSREPKILHSSFEDCALECNNVEGISKHYLKWFIDNRNQKYMFPKLLQYCKNINKLFDLGIYIPTIGLESFNYNYSNLTLNDVLKIMPDFTNKIWLNYKDINIMELLPKYNIDFRRLSKQNCIAFYNTFYQNTIEFYNKVFIDKNLRIDDVKQLKYLSYYQAETLLKTWNEKRGLIERLNELLIIKVDYVDLIKLRNKNIYNGNLKLLNQIYNETDHEHIIEFIIKNNIIIDDHNDIKLIKNEKLIHNLSWKIINNENKFRELFKHFITNNVQLDYDPDKISKYIHLIDCTNILNEDQIDDLTLSHGVKINQNIIKLWLKINDINNILDAPREIISEMFDEIYNKIVEIKYELNKESSISLLEGYIYSNSNLTFEQVYSIVEQTDYDTLGSTWIKCRKTDPPFELWPVTPNKELQDAYIRYISTNLPREYTERRFYDYMIKNKSRRANECTAVYTLFSNNNEHKIIFIDDNNLLESPAKKRMIIPIKYETIKTFIGEELDTNNITMLTKISGSDFDKICGGNHLIDCFVYSDIKNIYRERTPLKQILEYFANVLQIKFNIKVIYE